MLSCIGSLIPVYAKELNRNEADFSIILIARGFGYIIGSIVNPKYLIPSFKNINHSMGYVILILGITGLVGS